MKWDEIVVQTDSRCIVCASYHLCFSAVQWCLVCWPADNSYIIKKKKTNQTLPSSGMKMRCGWKFLDWSHWSVNCHPQTAINCSCQLYCSWEMRGLSFFFYCNTSWGCFQIYRATSQWLRHEKKKKYKLLQQVHTVLETQAAPHDALWHFHKCCGGTCCTCCWGTMTVLRIKG